MKCVTCGFEMTTGGHACNGMSHGQHYGNFGQGPNESGVNQQAYIQYMASQSQKTAQELHFEIMNKLDRLEKLITGFRPVEKDE